MTEKQYRQHPAINFSSLVWLDKNVRLYYRNKYNHVEEEDKPYFAVGGGLDTLITGSLEDFKKQYYILKHDRPSGLLGTFIDKYVFFISKGVPENIAFDQAYIDTGYKQSKETVRKNLEENAYYKEKLKYEGKYRILDAKDGELVMNMANTFMKWDRSRKWLTKKEGVEIKTQFAIIFPCGTRECKALLDILYIDHVNKKICPIDLKTTGEVIEEFRAKFVANRYYLQAAMYTDAVQHWVLLEKMSGRDYSDYVIENFRFLVIEKAIDSVPMIYQCNEDDLKLGRHGNIVYGKYRRGYMELVNDLSWHEANKIWNAPREAYEANSEVIIGVCKDVSSRSTEEAQTLHF